MSENDAYLSPEQKKALELLKKKGILTVEREDAENVTVRMDTDILLKAKQFDKQRTKLVKRLAEYGHEVEGVEELTTIEDLGNLAGILSDLEKGKGGEKKGSSGTAPLSSAEGPSDLESKSYNSVEALIDDLLRHETMKHSSSGEATAILNKITKKVFKGQKKLDRPINIEINPKRVNPVTGKEEHVPYTTLFNEEARRRELLKRKLKREEREEAD